MQPHPSYLKVFGTFARNSLIRDMTFRTNFVLQCISSVSWTLMNVGFYLIVFNHTTRIGTDWGKHEYFVFLATLWFITSVVQAFFMPNAQEFSELIRTGNLDFALLKPIDTQFLISFHKVEWSALSNLVVGAIMLSYGMWHLCTRPVDPLTLSWVSLLLYPFYLACGVAIFYSLMISLAATSIWLGRNQSLYNFWFYITSFARYPMEIYNRGMGRPLWGFFTFVIPVLLVVNIPARVMARPLFPEQSLDARLAGYAVGITAMSLLLSRLIFRRALLSYRSASS